MLEVEQKKKSTISFRICWGEFFESIRMVGAYVKAVFSERYEDTRSNCKPEGVLKHMVDGILSLILERNEKCIPDSFVALVSQDSMETCADHQALVGLMISHLFYVSLC